QLYEQAGQFDKAAEIIRRQAGQNAVPVDRAQLLYAAAQMSESIGDLETAIHTMREAVTAMADVTNPDSLNNQRQFLQQLANMLNDAGQRDEADRVWNSLLAQGDPTIGARYASYLNGTGRAAQAEVYLKKLLEDVSPDDPTKLEIEAAFEESARALGKPQQT